MPYTTLLLFSALSLADIGPPPRCPEGKYRVYLYGHHCVTVGYHLEEDENGELTEVKDDPSSNTASTPDAPPVKRKGCSRARGSQSVMLLGALSLLGWRRRQV